jgi:hypothetical protein
LSIRLVAKTRRRGFPMLWSFRRRSGSPFD